MKICIIGNYSKRLDEGMANVSYNLYSSLRSKYSCNNLRLLDIQNIKSPEFWKTVFKMKPDIVHYTPGPSLKGLMFVKLIQLLIESQSVISATQPYLPHNALFKKFIAPLLRPNIVLAQSYESERFFKSIQYITRFIPNGVDTERFVSVNSAKKSELRRKYRFKNEDFIVLHIGPLKRGRNQRCLTKIRDIKLLLITSLTNPSEEEAYREIANTDAIIWKEYFPKIEEIYAMSDVYVWPAFEKFHGIEMPLSVLEAMSCNLPVITTKYGALNRVFQPKDDGLIFVETEDQIQEALMKIKQHRIKVSTREKVKVLSWENIANEIACIYSNLHRENDE